MESISTMHFEFDNYQVAFDTWNRNIEIYGKDMQMVVSHHEYSSGYWIEKAGTSVYSSQDFLYAFDSVPSLIERTLKGVKNGESPETIL